MWAELLTEVQGMTRAEAGRHIERRLPELGYLLISYPDLYGAIHRSWKMKVDKWHDEDRCLGRIVWKELENG